MGKLLKSILTIAIALADKCGSACAAACSRLYIVSNRVGARSFNYLHKLITDRRLSVLCRRFVRRLQKICSNFPGRAHSLSSSIKSIFSSTNDPFVLPASKTELDPSVLNCRARLGSGTDGVDVSAIEIDICGSIHALTDKDEATLKITVFDVTGKCRDPKPVLAGTTQWRIKDSGVFCYTGELGRLTGRDTVLSDWTSVAKLQIDWLLLPRSGKRQLFFHISILSRRDSQEMASADYVMAFTNRRFGYLDMQENRLRTRKLAIEVAFAVSAADGKLFRCEVDVIKDWAREDMAYSHATDDDRRRIDKILKKTFGFFRKGRKFNMRRACEEIVNIASPARRHDIVELCLRVAAANGFAVRDELAILRDLADWLEIEPDVFRGIMEKALPVNMHEVKDAEVVLGVTRDMNEETARRHLNKEYSKWNARVTNSDPQIQAQADEMLGLIADTRREYIG